MTPKFNPLKISAVQRDNGDSARLRFAVPAELRAAYKFRAGQYLTLRATVQGESLRRSYSICTSEQEYEQHGVLEVGIKRVAGGLFSNFALGLKKGDTLEVMTPEGMFGEAPAASLNEEPAGERHYVAFAAGSGITPLMAMMGTWLARHPATSFTLVYGNRNVDSVMFLEEIAALKNKYMSRLRLFNVLSRQPQEVELFNGRLDEARTTAFLAQLIEPASIDEAFVCGPHSMIDEVETALLRAGLPKTCLHAERFGVPGERKAAEPVYDDKAPAASLKVILDGKQSEMRLPFGGAKVLDVALRQGLDLPFACKGGVCCTCRAKVLEGEVTMEKNYSLEDHEIAKGFVLTCQAMAKSQNIVISYDER